MSDVFDSKVTDPSFDEFSAAPKDKRSTKKKKGGLRRDQSCVVRDLITALAVCHNVTPTYPNPDD